ncbi:MAG: flagellar filament capping protein FliD [Chromatiales bacterium]|nr:flagellar filament capping protein FliD [Chromatiales bacterium]
MAVERQPLVRLDQKEAVIQAEISAYGLLKGGLSSLQSSLSKLEDKDTFQASKASSSDQDVLTVSSEPGAVTSSYNIEVNRLAQQHKLGSSEFSSSDTFGGAAGDELTLTVGTESFTLDLSAGMTLSEIQTAINDESNETGVVAGLITGDSGNQTLVLTAKESGYDNRVQLSYGGAINSSTFNFSMLNRDENDQLLASENELNSSLTIDGVSVTRNTNSISDAVDGLTLDLKATGKSFVSIDKDYSAATDAINNFVAAYNGLKDQLAQVSITASGSVIRGVESQLRNVLNDALTGLGSYTHISQLGVTSNAQTGKLEFDSSQLTDAMKENPDSVTSFFTDETSGFAYRMDTMLEGYLQTGGTMDSLLDNANSRVDTIGRDRESLERRMESVEARYLQEFTTLDTLMASMSTTSQYLTTQLTALSNLTTGNNN